MANQILNDDTKIEVQSLVPYVFYCCPITFEYFPWIETGEIHEMTYKQIRIMKAKHPRYFSERWLKPLNDDVLEKIGLKKLYENGLSRGDLKLLCGNDIEAAEEMLTNLNPDSKSELAKRVVKITKDGKIANVKIIRLLEKHLGVELMQYI